MPEPKKESRANGVKSSAARSIFDKSSDRIRLTAIQDRKSTRLNSSHTVRSYAAFCLKKQTLPIEDLDALVLSHAHIDHSGRLPFLTPDGYSGSIWATSATRDLSAVILADSAHIQAND